MEGYALTLQPLEWYRSELGEPAMSQRELREGCISRSTRTTKNYGLPKIPAYSHHYA